VPIVIGGLILSALVMLLFGGTELDRALLVLFSGGDTPRLDQAATIAVAATQPMPLIALALAGAGLCALRRDWRRGLLLLGLALLGRLLVDAVQAFTESVRPSVDERFPAFQQGGYPSGHAANAAITGFALAFLLTRHYPARSLALGAAAACALILGAAPLIGGGAWPSDVIGGWALGLAWVLLVLRVAGEDLGDGTARPVRHSSPQGESHGQSQDRDRPRDGR
jgi:undecaprenyl-diphosphatase